MATRNSCECLRWEVRTGLTVSDRVYWEYWFAQDPDDTAGGYLIGQSDGQFDLYVDFGNDACEYIATSIDMQSVKFLAERHLQLHEIE